jgi:hypothetical protein
MFRYSRSALAILTMVAASLFVVTPAHAGALGVTCTLPSSDVVTYDPPLTNQPQLTTVHSHTVYHPCVSSAVSSGSRVNTIMREASCSDLLAPGHTTFEIAWDTGHTSTISAERTSTIVGVTLIVTFAGHVASGLFADALVVQTLTGVASSILSCQLGLNTVPSLKSFVTLQIGPTLMG